MTDSGRTAEEYGSQPKEQIQAPAMKHSSEVAYVERSEKQNGVDDVPDRDSQSTAVNLQEEEKNLKEDGSFTKWLRRQGGVPNSPVVDAVFQSIIIIICWGLLLAIFREDALPNGSVFNIFILLVLANIVGSLFRLIKLPGLFGMLLVGITLRSINFYHVAPPYNEISSLAREFALAVILTKAGLALDPEILKKKAFTVLKLSLLPCIGESIVAAVGAHCVIGLPWLWATLLGFVLSPISPAVVVPTLISLKERGYGEDKGIATLVIAASAVDDVFSIVAFGVVIKMIFTPGEGIYTTLISGPVDFVGGIIIGLLWALCCAAIPNKTDVKCTSKRSAMLGIGGIALVLGSSALNHAVVGTLGSITASLFCNICWSIQDPSYNERNPVSQVLSVVWKYTEPVLFAMVGAEIDVMAIPPAMIAQGIAVLAIGLVGRILVCYLSLYGTGLNIREVAFVIMAWLPKATVQAAISASALDRVREEPNPSEQQVTQATWILNTAILSIIITAPIGSIAISTLGTKLLDRKTK